MQPDTFPFGTGIFSSLDGVDYEAALKRALKIQERELKKLPAEELNRDIEIWKIDVGEQLPWNYIDLEYILSSSSVKDKTFTFEQKQTLLDVLNRSLNKSLPEGVRFLYDSLYFTLTYL